MASMTSAALPAALEGLDHVALTVGDPRASMQWYQEVLGLRPAAMEGLAEGPPFILRISDTSFLNLFPADGADPAPSPDHNTLAMRHVALRVAYGRINEVEEDLRRRGQTVTAFDYGPRCRSLFLQDPDGHQLELIGYGEGVFTA